MRARGIGGVAVQTPKPETEADSRLDAVLANNPLLQCGLVLAGANRRCRSKESDREDGILTGLEAASLDLAGTKLVILSACDTGIGDVHVGDGVSSLRQAFLIAGADDVVASLWRVPDKETADLASSLVDHFAEGRSAGEALRQSQLQIMSERRAKHGTARSTAFASFTTGVGLEFLNRTTTTTSWMATKPIFVRTAGSTSKSRIRKVWSSTSRTRTDRR